MATESVLPVLLSKLHRLINELPGDTVAEVLKRPSPPAELTGFIPDDLVVRADGGVSLLGIVNTMLVRLGEPRVALVQDTTTGLVVDAYYLDGEPDGDGCALTDQTGN